MRFEDTVTAGVGEMEPVLRAAKKGASAASACSKMIESGEIKNIARKLGEAEQELTRAVEGIREFRGKWESSEIGDYFGSDDYMAELKVLLDELGVDYHTLGDVLYVYPALVRLDPNSNVVRIDKKAEVRVRPRALAGILQAVQNRPTRFPAGRFLGSLFKVYKALATSNLKRNEPWAGKSLYLRDIYEVIAAAPGSDYSEQEFVRDIYLLDASGESLEVRGHVAVLEASSSTRDERKTMSIITRDGQRRLYCTIRFNPNYASAVASDRLSAEAC
ncbi:MAG: hypothetical protein HYX78_15400 [Armatimonadetes bacterium]|nr:hypothetical protein [Armatimonadota bacterium]